MSGFRLVHASDGERVRIVGLDGGIGAHRKLMDLGLAPGRFVEVVARTPGGPMLLAVGESRVAVGLGLAMKVRVAAEAEGGGE